MSGISETLSPSQIAMLRGAGNSVIVLKTSYTLVGRGVSGEHDINITPDDSQVSREHARLIMEMGRWYLEDCSRNGTLLNGELIHGQRVLLHPGDRIQIGRSFDYTFSEMNATAESTAFEPMVAGAVPHGPPHETPPAGAGIWISPSAAVWRDGELLPANLSRTEYRLLKFLARHPGDVCDYDATINAVWGVPRDKDSLHELIYRVRRKIEVDPAQPRFLIIRAGIGVVFLPQGSDALA